MFVTLVDSFKIFHIFYRWDRSPSDKYDYIVDVKKFPAKD